MRAVALAILLTLCLAVSASAQEASLGGRVVDSTGGIVPGAAVILTSTATAESSETVTNNEGLFSFPSTRPGVYSVKVSLTGFATATVNQIRIEIGEARNLVIPVQPGQLEETVVVVGAGATPLLARRSERSVVVEHRNLELLIEKRFATGGSSSFDFRIEVFNATNYVQFAGPGTSIATASFGRIFYQQVNTPRQVQLGGRFTF